MVTLVEKALSGICLVLLLFAVTSGSGCLGSGSEEAVNETVMGFLNSFNEGSFEAAFSYYEGTDFLVPATLEIKFKNRGMVAGSIKQITVKDMVIEGDVAYLTADCTVDVIEKGEVVGTTAIPVYMRTQKVGSLWLVTKVNFDAPISASGTDLVNVEVPATPLDPLVDNAPIIGGIGIVVIIAGLVFNKKNKSGGGSAPSVDISNATPVDGASLAQFIKIMPPAQCATGQGIEVDVWVKNFYQQPYENLVVIATFPSTVKVKKATLSFGSVGPGETVKRSWKLTPNAPGWVSIDEPTVVFEFGGGRYSGQLEQAWLNVQ